LCNAISFSPGGWKVATTMLDVLERKGIEFIEGGVRLVRPKKR